MFDRTPVPQTIARTLQEMIRTGELAPDQKIPSQRALSERLKVSRASLREALLTLETLGLVRTLPARGTFVTGPATRPQKGATAWRYGSDVSLREVFQSRLLIEAELCRLAASSISPDQVAALHAVSRDFERTWNEGDLLAHVEADLAFHRLICDACPNRMLRDLYNSIQALVTETQRQPIPNTATDRMAVSIAEHRAIAAALEARDPASARTRMTTHIRNTAACAGIALD